MPCVLSHSGCWSFHFSFTAETSIAHASALLTILLAFPTTGASIILPSNVQAPLPCRSAFSSAITTLTAHSTSFSPGANAFCTISTWLGCIHCFPLKPRPLPLMHSSSSVLWPSSPLYAVQTRSIVEGRSWARHAVAIADLANKNSVNEGVRVNDRSRAKSSAANIRPERYGVALQILERSVRALADSTRASILMGGISGLETAGELECRDGSVCRITSVIKCRSEAELTFGTTMVSTFGAFS